jgi:hypothetical protein
MTTTADDREEDYSGVFDDDDDFPDVFAMAATAAAAAAFGGGGVGGGAKRLAHVARPRSPARYRGSGGCGGSGRASATSPLTESGSSGSSGGRSVRFSAVAEEAGDAPADLADAPDDRIARWDEIRALTTFRWRVKEAVRQRYRETSPGCDADAWVHSDGMEASEDVIPEFVAAAAATRVEEASAWRELLRDWHIATIAAVGYATVDAWSCWARTRLIACSAWSTANASPKLEAEKIAVFNAVVPPPPPRPASARKKAPPAP